MDRSGSVAVGIASRLYLFASTLLLVAAQMPAVVYMLFKVEWPWGRIVFLLMGFAFVLLCRSFVPLQVAGTVYFAAAALYLAALAYLLTALSAAYAIAFLLAGALVAVLATRWFWAVMAASALALAAFAFSVSAVVGLAVAITFLFLVPRRLMGYLAPVSLALVVVSFGLHIFALDFFEERKEPRVMGAAELVELGRDVLPQGARVRFAEEIGNGRWILGLRGAESTLVEWDAVRNSLLAESGGSGESSDDAAIDKGSKLIYFGDYGRGCVEARTFEGLQLAKRTCLQGLRPTFLALDGDRRILYVASDFSEQFFALDADSLKLVASVARKGGIHHFCTFPDGRVAAVSGLGRVYLFEPGLEKGRELGKVLGFFIFHVACDARRGAVYVASFASGWLYGFALDGRVIFKEWLGPAIRYMALDGDFLAVSNYFSGRVHIFDLKELVEMRRIDAALGITQLVFAGGRRLRITVGRGVYEVSF